MDRHAVCILILLLLSGCAEAPAPDPPPATATSVKEQAHVPWGPVDHGLRTRIVPLQEEFALGRPMLFRLEFKNERQNSVTFTDRWDEWDALEVTGPDGTEAPAIRMRICQTFVTSREIGPGETVVLADRIDIWHLLCMTASGTYRVRYPGHYLQVEYASLPEVEPPKADADDPLLPFDDYQLTVPSNEVAIEVGESSKPLPPAYVLVGKIHAIAREKWYVMLEKTGRESEPGTIALYAEKNWIHVAVADGFSGSAPPGWEDWGRSDFGHVRVCIPVRAESRWPDVRRDFQDVLHATDPRLSRTSREKDLLDLYGAIRKKDEARLIDLVKAFHPLVFRRLELDSGLIGGREETLLHIAARLGMHELARLLLDLGAKVNSLSRSGATALIFAAETDDLAMARLLVERGADPKLRDKGTRDPVGTAAARGHVKVLRFLIESGADVDGPTTGNLCRTALGDAVLCNRPDSVRVLLELGAKPDFTRGSETPLFSACEARVDPEIVRLLVAAGANVDAPLEGTRQTPLHLACEKGRLETVRILVENGARLNDLDGNSKTPLDYAAGRSDGREMAAYLRSKGAHHAVR